MLQLGQPSRPRSGHLGNLSVPQQVPAPALALPLAPAALWLERSTLCTPCPPRPQTSRQSLPSSSLAPLALEFLECPPSWHPGLMSRKGAWLRALLTTLFYPSEQLENESKAGGKGAFRFLIFKTKIKLSIGFEMLVWGTWLFAGTIKIHCICQDLRPHPQWSSIPIRGLCHPPPGSTGHRHRAAGIPSDPPGSPSPWPS